MTKEGAEKVKFKLADIEKLPYNNDCFDSVVATQVLNSCYSPQQALGEIIRVTKPKGKILMIEKGLSSFSMYNSYLIKKAAKDLLDKGSVYHLDIESIVGETQGVKVKHKERKNLGMTYVFILEKE